MDLNNVMITLMRHKLSTMFGSNPLEGSMVSKQLVYRIYPTSLIIHEKCIAMKGHTTFLVHFTMLWPRAHYIIKSVTMFCLVIVVGSCIPPFSHPQCGGKSYTWRIISSPCSTLDHDLFF